MGDEIEALSSRAFAEIQRGQDAARPQEAETPPQRRAELDALERFQAAIAAQRVSDASTR